jgi:hypothetical protein
LVKIEGRFSELGKNKNEIMMRLVSNENIVKALTYNNTDFLNQPTPEDAVGLIYTQIFPYQKVPTTQDTAKTFITMKFGYKPDGTFFKVSTIFFYVITHISLVRTDYGILRYDFLINEIDKMFNSQRGIGIGKLPFYAMDDFQVSGNSDWLGAFVAYKSTEFN